ncbi:DUF2252 domain-containing protein [Deminuibacter soli]|nr:DUF2252 family protein [Deminuibacter soli]
MATVYDRITAYNHNRVPELLALKYRFISEDPFRFFRGTCHLFYEDLAKQISWKDNTRAWICGDLHLENFGSYKGDNRVVYFDLNDFDEAIQAPVSWELVRLLTSIYIAGNQVGFDEQTAEVLCQDYLDTYLHVLKNGKALAVEKETAEGLLRFFLQQVKLRREKDFVQTRLTLKKDRVRLLIDNKKSMQVTPETRKKIIRQTDEWLQAHEPLSRYRTLDAAYRIAGTGSVGLQRYVLLVQDKKTNRLRLLDLKQATPSSLQPYVLLPQPDWKNNAARIIAIQKRMQYVSPALLHEVKIDRMHFVLKELQPTSDRMNLALCKGKRGKLNTILSTMALLTASGQLRSAGRDGSGIADELIAFADAGSRWKKTILQYAKQYAAQVMKDYASYKDAYKNSKAGSKSA